MNVIEAFSLNKKNHAIHLINEDMALLFRADDVGQILETNNVHELMADF